MLCQECEKKSKCTKLCKKAEKWIDQDHVYLRESTTTDVNLELFDVHSKPINMEEIFIRFFDSDYYKSFLLTPLQEKCLFLLYFGRYSYSQIAIRTNRKVHAVNNCIYLGKQKILKFFYSNRDFMLK